MSADRVRRARPWHRPALVGLVAAAGLVASLIDPITAAPVASAATSSASSTTTPPTTTTSEPVPVSASSGCRSAVPARRGATFQAIRAGGDVGVYIRQVPTSYTARTPMPVVVQLHGYDVTAVDMTLLTQLGTYGNRNGFITVTPQVTRSMPYWQTASNGKDVAFLEAVIAKVTSTLCVDQNRIYVTGYSNGAIMASVLACVDAGQVAAIAPVSGVANPAHCSPSRPVPVVAFHGTADPLVRYTGGLGSLAYQLPLPPGTKGTISQLLGPNVPQSTSRAVDSEDHVRVGQTRRLRVEADDPSGRQERLADLLHLPSQQRRAALSHQGRRAHLARQRALRQGHEPRVHDDGHQRRQDHLELLHGASAEELSRGTFPNRPSRRLLIVTDRHTTTTRF